MSDSIWMDVGDLVEFPDQAPVLKRVDGRRLAVVRDGADRAEYGFDHGLALLADACSWAERGWIDPAEAFAIGAACIAEPSHHLGARKVSTATPSAIDDVARVSADLIAERRDD